MAAVCPEPDGLLLPHQLDAPNHDRGQATADDGSACRRATASGRYRRRGRAVLVVPTTSLPGSGGHVRLRRAGGRLRRLRRHDIEGGLVVHDIFGWLAVAWRPERHEWRGGN